MRLIATAGCACLLAAGTAGCSTTQEKAAAQQAKAEHILKARAERQKAKRKHRHDVDGPKTHDIGGFSAHQQGRAGAGG